VSEKKRGRPRKTEVEVWERKYYFLSEARDNQAIRKVAEERMFKGFEEIHRLANERELGWFEINIVKKRIGDILDTI
jgi:AT hook motif